ncbi:hypothetical protein SSBR45G_34100 [Bradyrhizobium sp. SSBR45G]|nr:hypothetical protein SSBR45G_34100 [Bradyrhizobium sp. SSBR45G]
MTGGRRPSGLPWTVIMCLLCGGLLPRPASACSLVDVQRSVAEAAGVAQAWWIASAALAIAIVVADIRRRRFSLLLVAASLLVVFHPAWWVRPDYLPDCSFPIVDASRFVFAVLCAMVCYQLVRAWRARRSAR